MRKTLLTLSLGALLASSPLFAANDFAAALKAAEASRAEAGKLGYEWRDTGKLIKTAKILANKGDTAKAISLVKKAEKQAQDAVAQYHSETNRFKANHQ